MLLLRSFRSWLLVLSTAVSALHYHESSSYRTLVRRAGPEPYHSDGDPPRLLPDSSRPKFPTVPPEQVEQIYNVNWETSLESLLPHYKPFDTKKNPPDAGMDISFQYDLKTQSVALYFAPNDASDHTPGPFIGEYSIMLYRMPGSDGNRRSQRYTTLPSGIDPQVLKEEVRQGNDHLDRFLRQFIQPPDKNPDKLKKQYIPQFTDYLIGRLHAKELTRLQSRWVLEQFKSAFNRHASGVASERDGRTLPKRERLLKERRDLQERADTLMTINEQVDQPNQNSSTEQSAEFQTTLNAYYTLLSNITSLLFPVLNELITDTDNPILYQMALSIYIDITMAPQQIATPFKNGMTAFTDLENQYLNRTNATISPNGTIANSRNRSDIIFMLALHAVYEQIYLFVWDKAINATNSTGLLSCLYILTGYTLPADPSIAPPGWINTPLSLNSSADMEGLIKYAKFTTTND